MNVASFDYLTRLHGMLASGRIDDFVRENELKLEEITTRGYGISPAPMRRSLTETIQKHSQDRDWKLLTLERKEIDMRLVAGTRMVECMRNNWQHALQYSKRNSEDSFFLPTMIGLLGDSWRILR
jgi:hypothetical protein